METKIEIIIKEFALFQLEKEYSYYYNEYSEKYADSFYYSFFKKIEDLEPYYLSHPECRFLKTKAMKYRNIVWNNYLIVYKINKNLIEVLSLFHTKQNPTKLKSIRRIK
jgi:toxin ParE1/3/4